MRVWRVAARFAVQAYNPAKNYYKILSVGEQASQPEIKKAFRDLAKKYHPDTNKGKEELFKEVNEAYQVLSDSTVKQEYDQVRQATSPSPRAHNSSSTSSSNQQKNQQQKNQQYRGYQREEGWKNMNFRDQFMYDLYRQQQADHSRNFEQAQREKMEREFRERMREAARK
jgi:curved DNA-binding protein CbpA